MSSMLRLAVSGKAESHCVDGDIKRVAGNINEATLAYLNAHIADPQFTTVHLNVLESEHKSEITAVLEEWLKTDDESRAIRKKYGVRATPDEIWSFIFNLQPQAVTTCFARIEPLLKERRYQQVIDSCTAILNHYSSDTAPILLQRALAYTLMGNHEKLAISDYLRAFIKDKDATIQVVRSKHSQHLPQITDTLRDCVYSQAPNTSLESKQMKKWLQLTVDCCKLLLTLDPNNFQLQMTYVERLTKWSKIEQAVAALNECIGVLQLDLEPDSRKLAEAWLRLGQCSMIKNQADLATTHITRGLNEATDKQVSVFNKAAKQATSVNSSTSTSHNVEYDITMTFLEDNHEVQHTAKLAREILGEKSGELTEVYVILDKAASRLNPSDKFGGVMKLDNIRQALDIYRAILVFKPRHRETLIRLALCYSKLGRHNYAIKIYDFLLSKKDYAQDNAILSARAACYRELGKKVEARKDYDTLLKDSPKDASLLFERSLVHLENKEIDSLVNDLQAACKSNQRTVSICMNKLPLAQRTKIRQILFEHSKALLQEAQMPDIGKKDSIDTSPNSAGSMALTISQLLTKLNSADHASHIIKAHALFFVGNFSDAEVSLKRLLHDNAENPDNHMIKLHLGLLRILTKRTGEGMTSLVEVLSSNGERLVSNLLRDIPVSERGRLSEESHQYAINILQKRRDQDVVRFAAHCFTIAILCCRGTELILEGSQKSDTLWNILVDSECLVGIRKKSNKMTNSAWALSFVDVYDEYRPPKCSIFSGARERKLNFNIEHIFPKKSIIHRLNGVTGVCRSYLARAECMAHLGDQQSAVLDFSAALEVNPSCVEGLCGRSFMRLALGDENECIDDIAVACELDIFTVTAHINALPDEARNLLEFWIDHRVVALLLNHGYKAGTYDRLNTSGSLSTISITDETAYKAEYQDCSRQSSLTSMASPTPSKTNEANNVTNNQTSMGENIAQNESPNENNTGPKPVTTLKKNSGTETVVADVHASDFLDAETGLKDVHGRQENGYANRRLHRSSTSSRHMDEELLKSNPPVLHENSGVKDEMSAQYSKEDQKLLNDSRQSTVTTNASSFGYDDLISGMEKAELLNKAQLLGKLLITLDGANASWHGMYADILIVKGEFDDALRHLQIVLQITPSDITAIARAGLINVKQNRYRPACALLSVLVEIDKNGLAYVLRALDRSRQRRLAEEALSIANSLSANENYSKAIDYYGLSLYASGDKRAEKLRMRAKCFTKIREIRHAIEDITTVIKESSRNIKAGDYCTRAHIYLLDNKEREACLDYMKALKIDS
ncbi:uncharacterized protein LOC120328794 isoform X2 [Styela clava]